MNNSSKVLGARTRATQSFFIMVLLLAIAFVGAAIGSLAPIDFIYDGI